MNDSGLAAMNQHPKVWAVVLNYNSLQDTETCIRSLRDSGYPNLGVVLVDNASPDGSGDALARLFPELPLLRQHTNGGYGAGNNAGIRYALARDAKYLLIVNSDVIVQKGTLEPMVSMLERDVGLGVVNGKVFYLSAPDELFSALGEFSRWMCTGLNVGRDRVGCSSTTLECDVDYVCGVMLLVRREVFQEVGLLEEGFFMYFEDVEFSRRVLTRYRLGYTARAIAYHRSGGGKGWQSYTELYLYYHTRNRIRVFRNESRTYRAYVAVFTIANALAKAAVISRNCVSDPSKMLRQWKALCGGLTDGLFGGEE